MIDDPQNDQNQNSEKDTTFTEEDDDQKHQKSEPPSVKGEEDIFSGDTPVSGEDYDIDEERSKVGLTNENTPADLEDQLDEEEG